MCICGPNVFDPATKNQTTEIISSWRHRQSCLGGRWSLCADHGLEHPNSVGDHGERGSS